MTSLYIISYDNITHLLPCVCRCFLTEQTEGGGRLAAPSPPAACNRFLRFDIDNVFHINDVGHIGNVVDVDKVGFYISAGGSHGT